MNPNKPSKPLRTEVGIQSEFLWNPSQFSVPRFYAIDLGKIGRKIVYYSVVASLAYGLFYFFWR